MTITGGVSLCGTAFVRLEHLTFVSNPIYESSTVLVVGSDEFYLGHCILRDKDDTQEYDDNEALLKLTGTYKAASPSRER